MTKDELAELLEESEETLAREKVIMLEDLLETAKVFVGAPLVAGLLAFWLL
jgi:hypothetical protein